MIRIIQHLALLAVFIFTSCAANRSPDSAEAPQTIGMPTRLSDRERHFLPQVQSVLRSEGLVPIANGRADRWLEFKISEGPTHTNTVIKLIEGETLLAKSSGRAAVVPGISRADVAGKSFSAAIADFKIDLSGVSARRGWNRRANYFNDPAPRPFTSDQKLPPY